MWGLSINITYRAQIIIHNFLKSQKIADITMSSHHSIQQPILSTSLSGEPQICRLQLLFFSPIIITIIIIMIPSISAIKVNKDATQIHL